MCAIQRLVGSLLGIKARRVIATQRSYTHADATAAQVKEGDRDCHPDGRCKAVGPAVLVKEPVTPGGRGEGAVHVGERVARFDPVEVVAAGWVVWIEKDRTLLCDDC